MEWTSRNFNPAILEKRGDGVGLVVLQSLWSIKKGIITFNFLLNEPSLNIVEPPGKHDHPGEKTNLHP